MLEITNKIEGQILTEIVSNPRDNSLHDNNQGLQHHAGFNAMPIEIIQINLQVIMNLLTIHRTEQCMFLSCIDNLTL